MSFLEILTLFASGVTIFAFIVGLFSVYNGRMTRRELAALIHESHSDTQRFIRETHADTLTLLRETRDLIAREEEATRQLVRETQETTRRLIQENQEASQRILQGIVDILGRIDARVR